MTDPMPDIALDASSAREEFASSIIQGFGILLSIAGLVVLSTRAGAHGDARLIASIAIYGATLVLLYTASTLHHGVTVERIKPLLRQLDHSAIFLLIAGTYTPFTLITLEGPWGWSLFAIVWALALTGMGLVIGRFEKHGVVVALYLALGWIGLIAIGPLMQRLPPAALGLVFGGGACFTLGVPFYLWKRLPFNHALWHVFVMAGCMLQFFAVLLYVVPSVAR